MAVRIPIITVFDSKGLKAAQYQLNKVRGNFQNLGRNAAIAGAAIGAFAAVIGTSVKALSRIEAINAQTNAVLKSMGTTANGTAKDIENLAGELEALTATEAETIQEGANLLLTFRNITNQMGAGNDIFNRTTAIMVDMARALNEGVASSAIRLGKALNDPIRGLTALRKVGVGFSQEQENQIRILQESGDIMGAQKIILSELQAQFGGSGAAFAQTFAGQVELLNHELGALGEEATLIVMPALRGLVEGLREVAPEIGPKLKAAIESVDWQALAKSIVDVITFLVQNAETIMRVVGALFILNTTYNALRAAQGIYNAVAAFTNVLLKDTANSSRLATTAVNTLRTALLLGGVTLAVGGVIDEYRRLRTAIQSSTAQVSRFNAEVIATSGAAARLSPIATLWQRITTSILGAVTAQARFNAMPARTAATSRPSIGGARSGGASGLVPGVTAPSVSGGRGSAAPKPPTFNQTLQRQVTISRKTGRLIAAGLSEGLAQAITSSAKPVQAANNILDRIRRNGQTAVNRLQNQFNQTFAGQAELSNIAAQAEAAAAEAAAKAEQQAFELAQIQDEQLRKQQELANEQQRILEEQAREEERILEEKKRVYDSFLSSVESVFSQIRDSITGAFDLPKLGGSTDSIIRNMKKLLDRVRSFSSSITQLSTMGLNPELLQQVIAAGPVQGARLAAALVSGGAGALAQINEGFGEISSLASGIAETGTTSRFMTPTQQNIYNISVDGGVGSGATIGRAIVDAIKAYERTSGAVWQGA